MSTSAEFEVYLVPPILGNYERVEWTIEEGEWAYDPELLWGVYGESWRQLFCTIEILRKTPAFLGSFYKEDEFWNLCKHLERMDRLREKAIMLDSGAYTAWTKGVKIDINKYIDFIHMVRERFMFGSFHVVNLDVIPGSYNRQKNLTAGNINHAVKTSLKNYRKMKESGIDDVVAVHHYPETLEHLKMILNDEPLYLGLGGVAGSKEKKEIRRWFDKVFQYLDKADFKSPIHGFGVSAPTIIEEYPLSSVDSSSLVLGSGYGQVFIFDSDKEPKFKSYYVSSLEEKKVKKENLDYVLERTRVEAFKVDRDGLDEHWTRLLVNFENWLAYVNYLKKKKSPTKSEF